MTAKEIVFGIKNLRAGGIQSQSNSMSDLQYLALVDNYRSILIRQQMTKKQKVNEALIQTMESKIEPTYTNGVYLSMDKIPKAVELHETNLITYVGHDNMKGYQKTNGNSIVLVNFSRFTKEEPKWFHEGEKIAVINPISEDKIIIKGIFENPMKVVEFNGEEDVMDPLEFEYPISVTMLDTIFKMIVDAEFRLQMMVRKDTTNNSADEN